MYISLDRLASQQFRPTQWTLYGKILKKLFEKTPRDNRKEFEQIVDKYSNDKNFPYIENFVNTLRDQMKNQIGIDLKIKLSLIDPLHTIKNLKPYFIEYLLELDA